MTDFFERARALDKAATPGSWGVEGSRFGPEAYRNGQAWGLNWRQDLELVAAARSMLPAAVEALTRVRELHRPVESQWGDQACAECLNSWELEVVWPCPTYKATEVEG